MAVKTSVLSISSLLNPESDHNDDASSRHHHRRFPSRLYPTPSPKYPSLHPLSTTPRLKYESQFDSVYRQTLAHEEFYSATPNTPSSSSVKGNGTRGIIRYPPFDDLDNETKRLLEAKYNIEKINLIRQNSRHVPYSSEKKDFYVKTGRESLESESYRDEKSPYRCDYVSLFSCDVDLTDVVFHYTFSSPDDHSEHTVMWDYNNGLVRMTPFFKCCHYPKTTPAKMLSRNPGLKEITHSITGGSISAQGYWMPYECAKALCATFCFRIAEALIPLFGPTFPETCYYPGSPSFESMVIDQSIIIQSKNEAHYYYQESLLLRTQTSYPSPECSILQQAAFTSCGSSSIHSSPDTYCSEQDVPSSAVQLPPRKPLPSFRRQFTDHEHVPVHHEHEGSRYKLAPIQPHRQKLTPVRPGGKLSSQYVYAGDASVGYAAEVRDHPPAPCVSWGEDVRKRKNRSPDAHGSLAEGIYLQPYDCSRPAKHSRRSGKEGCGRGALVEKMEEKMLDGRELNRKVLEGKSISEQDAAQTLVTLRSPTRDHTL